MTRFETNLGFGTSWGRGITSFNIKLNLAQFDYYCPVKLKNSTLFLGGYSSLNYNYEISPWLHAGHTNWFSAIDFGPALYYETKIKNIPIAVSFRSSILSFVSRPVYEKEDYFYYLNFKQVVKNMHSNFKFASINKRYSAKIEVNLLKYTKNGWSLGYSFNYSAYYIEPKITILTNQLVLRKNFGFNKK